MPDEQDVEFTRIDERIDMEIVIGGTTTCAVSLTGTEIECGRQILNAVIDNILNAEQKAKRVAKGGQRNDPPPEDEDDMRRLVGG